MVKKKPIAVKKKTAVAKRIVNKMKPNQLPKNTKTTIRINKAIKDRLKKDGISIQREVDNLINKLYDKIDIDQAIAKELDEKLKKK